nr:26S proteasome non-ATPase regulatory subunit 10-like [Penaeus vannamei]
MTTFARRWNLDSQLLVAIQNNDVPRVHKLFQEGVDTDTRFSINSQQRPALCLCVENNAQDMVQLFVELGVSINQGDSQGLTALHIACSHTYIHLAGLLIKARANVNARTHQNHTPLHLAAMRGNSELVELLLSHRACVDTLDDDNRTALHYAAASGNADLVELLLSAGADPSLLDNMGNTPLHYAVDVSGMPAHVVRQLASAHPPAVGITNRSTETPLHIAVRNGRCDAESVLQAALEYGTKGQYDFLGSYSVAPCWRDATWGLCVLSSCRLVLVLSASFMYGGVIECKYRTQEESSLLHDATRQPPKLSSVCRRALTLHLGPASLLALSKTTLPTTWRDFLTYKSVNI